MIIGLGNDIIEIARIKKALAKNQRFAHKIFTPQEISDCLAKGRPEASFAARFAAKEAVSKAFGTGIGRINWLDIEIYQDEQHKPSIRLAGRAAELATVKAVTQVHLTMSHSKEYATAVAVLEGK